MVDNDKISILREENWLYWVGAQAAVAMGDPEMLWRMAVCAQNTIDQIERLGGDPGEGFEEWKQENAELISACREGRVQYPEIIEHLVRQIGVMHGYDYDALPDTLDELHQ